MSKPRELETHQENYKGRMTKSVWVVTGVHKIAVSAVALAGTYQVKSMTLNDNRTGVGLNDPTFTDMESGAAILLATDLVQQLRRLPDTHGGWLASCDVTHLLAWCYMEEIDRRMWWFRRHNKEITHLPDCMSITRAGIKQRKTYGKILNRKRVKRECMEYLNAWREQ